MDRTHPEAIVLKGVSKRYGARTVVRDVDLTVHGGVCLALIGHNGAGKTTLIKLMLGLTRPNRGQVRVLGENPVDKSFSVRRSRLGFLPENVAFDGTLTGAETLAFYARLKRQPVDSCDALLAQVGLAEVARRRVGAWSKGMRQRLGLAQALLGDPRVLLLDEPTTGLDPSLRRWFYQVIKEKREAGAAVVLSSHALNEIEACADRVAILRQGALVACGSLDELRRQAGLPVTIRVFVAPGEAAKVANGIGGKVELRKVNDHTLDLCCLGSDKMEVVRRIACLGGPVRDVDIMPPGLGAIYTHFTGEEGPQ